MGKFISAFLCTGLALLPAILLPVISNAQDDDYYNADFIRNEDFIYKDNIKTVLLFKRGFELSPPVITLNSPDRLMLVFDDLDTDVKSYRYTLIHCDAYWSTSDIRQTEYIDGFDDDEIRDYTFSFNTIQSYTNYILTFPTNYLRLTKSGNYILKVFNGYDDPENVILTRRFMVVDPRVDVWAKVVKTTDLDDRYTGQEVDFKVIAKNYDIYDPYNNIHITVRQNGRWDNAVTNIQPRMVLGNELDFTLLEEFTFNGGNEFRYFDMKTVKYRTDRMHSLQYTTDGYEVILLPDISRSHKDYFTEDDIDGKRLIAANDVYNNYAQGEYVNVHFVLAYNRPVYNGNVYIMGALSNWQYTPENQMIYDSKLHAYVATLYLKQGYYNYCYAFLEDGSMEADVTMLEGSHWETENDYSIYVYHQQQGEYYDRLIAVKFLNSVRE